MVGEKFVVSKNFDKRKNFGQEKFLRHFLYSWVNKAEQQISGSSNISLRYIFVTVLVVKTST